MLRPGTPAPDFTATLDDGSTFRLADERGKRHVVLYFYPKDFTPGCTAQACSFRDNYDAIRARGAVVIGVSADDTVSHARFRERHALPFPLISDPERRLHELYDVKGWLPFLPPRVTYVIDREGIIRAALRHDLRVSAHVPEVLAALDRLTG
ncbi:MAG: peroxiredoxin [Chloroflexota bacterium]|nr:peroxiredoxin [Dehalococcoidia bacterium]MDW8047192.1 peroxiredoxin [Chloroflexota bacterium]